MFNSSATTTMPKSPEAYKRQTNSNRDDDVAKRMFNVDTLHVNKEKKLFFQKVNNDYDYFPFGTPGGGAPLRNQKNEPISRLPNIHQNLWRYGHAASENNVNKPAQQQQQQQTNTNLEQKKKQVLDLIDAYASNKAVSFATDPTMQYSYEPRKRTQHAEHRYDPVTRDHIRPETYWNDWFGRPGAGAPNNGAVKKSLTEMLEPRGGRGHQVENNYYHHEPSSMGASQTSPMFPARYRSNHQNNYEIPPQEEL